MSRDGRLRRGTVVAFSFSAMVPSASQTLLIPTVPTLTEERGFSVATAGWLLSAFLIGASLSAPLVGRLGDLRGRRMLTVCTSLSYVIGSLICLAGIEHGAVVAVGRAFQGISAGVFALHVSAIHELVTEASVRAAHIGVLSGVVAMGPAAGFVIGGVVTEAAGVTGIFALGVIAGTVSSALLWFWTPESGGGDTGHVDIAGAALVAGTLIFLFLLLAEVSSSGPARWVLLGCSAAAATLTVMWMRRPLVPFVDLAELMQNRDGALGNAATVLSSAAMFGIFVTVPQLVQGDAPGFGLGPIAAGLVLAPGAAAMALIGSIAARSGVRYGEGLVIAVGNVLCALGMLALGVLPQSVAVAVVLSTVASIGIGIAFPVMPSVVMGSVPTDRVGAAAGVNSLMRGIGSAAGAQVVLLVSVTSNTGEQRGGFIVSATCAVLAACVAARLMRRV